MKLKKFISGITAFALTASAFAGLAVSVNAEEDTVNTASIAADATYINENNADTNYYDAGVLYANQSKISGGKFVGMLSAYDGTDVTLAKFDASAYLGRITKATLKFDAICTVAGKNSNVELASIGTDWQPNTITWNTMNEIGTATFVVEVGNANSSGASFSYDVTDAVKKDADGIVGYGIYTYTGRQQKISNISLELEYADNVLNEVTINNVVGENVIKSYKDTVEADQPYEATAAHKGYKLVDGVYYMMKKDATTKIDKVSGDAVLNIEFEKADADYLVYEDFANITNIWGFTAGSSSVSLSGDHLVLTTTGKTSGSNDYGYYYSDVKDLSGYVGNEKYLDVNFKWKSAVEGGKNRKNAFELYDSNNNRLFSLQSQAAKGGSDTMGAGVSYGIGVAGFDGINIAGSGWSSGDSGMYDVALSLVFNGDKCVVSGTITSENGANEIIEPTTVTASDLAKIVASDIYSLAPQELHQFSIAKTPAQAVTFNVKNSVTNEAVKDAVITVNGVTATTDENGVAVMNLIDGTYTADIVCPLYASATADVTVSGVAVSIDVALQYLGVQTPSSIEISGGSDSVYKPASGTNTTEALTAVVNDDAGYPIEGETVVWSIQNPLDGVTVDSTTGVLTVADTTVLTDDNGIDIVLRATSTTDSSVYVEKSVHIYNVARITSFDIVGPIVVKDGTSVEYGVANVKDQYGVAMEADEAAYSVSNSKASFDGNVLSANLGIATEENAVVTVVMNGVTVTKNITIYGYDYYEPGRGQASYGIPRMETVNGEKVVVFPGLYDAAYDTTITLPVPVELSAGSAKKISFKNTWTTQQVYTAYRNLTFKNSNGDTVLKVTYSNGNVVLDAYKDGNTVTGTLIGTMGAAGTETEALFVLKTDSEGKTVAALQYNGTSIEKELGTNLGDIASYTMHDDKGCPAERMITLTDLKITDSDVAEIEVRGADEVAKISGKAAKSKYTASIFSQAEGETFTWSVTGADGVSIDENGVLSIPETVAVGTALDVTYTSDMNAGKTSTKQVTVRDYAGVESFDFDGPIAVSVGESAKYTVSNIIDSYKAVADMPVEYSIVSGTDIAVIDENGNLTPVAGAKTVVSDAVKVVAVYKADGSLESTSIEKVSAGAVVDTTASANSKVFLWNALDGANAMTPAATTASYKTGKVVVKATVGNPGLESEKTIEVNIGKFYEAGDVTADETVVDVASMENYSADTQYRVTVLTEDGTYAQEEVTSSNGKVVINTVNAVKYEVSPIYVKDNVGDARNDINFALVEGRYDISVQKSGTERGDLVVNGYVVGNNIDQNSSGRTKKDSVYSVNDVLVTGGKAAVKMAGYAGDGYMLKSITIKKAPSIVERKKHVYVLGDSLVCWYYGSYTSAADAQTGWGQVLSQFIKDDVNVTNLAESGNYAQGLYDSVFKTVLAQAVPGDILVFECGYNDRNYPGTLPSDSARYANMQNYMQLVNDEATAAGLNVVFVTPNASTHGTGWKEAVQGTDNVIEKANAMGAKYIDLSRKSFAYMGPKGVDYCYANFNAAGDSLHSSYIGAMLFASIVADGLTELGGEFAVVVDTTASYNFTDTTGATLTFPVR